MFIQTEKTPNPHVLKFLPGEMVLPEGKTAAYANVVEAEGSPLALRLFDVAGVEGVFLGADFVSVTRHPRKNWDKLKPLILAGLMDHFMEGGPAVERFVAPSENPEDDEVVARIKALLDEKIRPAVARDGGDIVFDRFEEGIVYVHLRGACAGCPAATMTLKMGVERLLREQITEVQEVRAVA